MGGTERKEVEVLEYRAWNECYGGRVLFQKEGD